VHYDPIYENYQQDATVYDNLLFLDSSTCFKRYFSLIISSITTVFTCFWYYSRTSLPAGVKVE